MISGREMLDNGLFLVHTHLEFSGEFVVSVAHQRPGHLYLSAGKLLIENTATHVELVAPCVFFIPAKERYRLMAAANDTVFSCVHHLQNGERRPPEVEK